MIFKIKKNTCFQAPCSLMEINDDIGLSRKHKREPQEFIRIVLCHRLWLKTEADAIRKDINYAG